MYSIHMGRATKVNPSIYSKNKDRSSPMQAGWTGNLWIQGRNPDLIFKVGSNRGRHPMSTCGLQMHTDIYGCRHAKHTHVHVWTSHRESQKVKGECIVSSYTMFNFIVYIAVMIFNLFLISSIISGFFSFGGLTEKGHPLSQAPQHLAHSWCHCFRKV